jgi:hypothetical protein
VLRDLSDLRKKPVWEVMDKKTRDNRTYLGLHGCLIAEPFSEGLCAKLGTAPLDIPGWKWDGMYVGGPPEGEEWSRIPLWGAPSESPEHWVAHPAGTDPLSIRYADVDEDYDGFAAIRMCAPWEVVAADRFYEWATGLWERIPVQKHLCTVCEPWEDRGECWNCKGKGWSSWRRVALPDKRLPPREG